LQWGKPQPPEVECGGGQHPQLQNRQKIKGWKRREKKLPDTSIINNSSGDDPKYLIKYLDID
jgi:hypothetical protein